MTVSPCFLVFRSSKFSLRAAALREKCTEFARTKYKKMAQRELAPTIADCLTAIYYLIKTLGALEIPFDFIGNMPRLLNDSGWNCLKVAQKEIHPGDLLFLKRRFRERREISHIGIAIDSETIFHCSSSPKRRIEEIGNIFSRYLQPDKETMRTYLDPRGSLNSV